jgi:acyl-CoA thioester hydrolase
MHTLTTTESTAMNKFIWPVRVYYEDTDAGGVVYHSNYLNFFERARTELLRAKGIEQSELKIKQQLIFVVRSVKIDYLKSAQFDDLLTVNSEISYLKKASLMFEQVICRGDVVLCKAEVYVACIDSCTMKPKAIPDDLIAEFL